MNTPLSNATTYWRLEYEYIKYGCDSLFFDEDNIEITSDETNVVDTLNSEIDKIKERMIIHGKEIKKFRCIYEREV